MCGRQTHRYTWAEIYAYYNLVNEAAPNLQPNYNLAPTQDMGTLVPDGGGLRYVPMRWGLVPSWWKKPLGELPTTFNARAETIAEKPMFRSAFANRRCLIPSDGFYEWDRAGGSRQPYFISMRNEPLMTFAGVFDEWTDPDTGEIGLSCAIVTCASNDTVGSIHHRMPVILGRDEWRAWLEEPRADLLKACPDDWLQMWPVSTQVNSTRHNTPENVVPAKDTGPAQQELF